MINEKVMQHNEDSFSILYIFKTCNSKQAGAKIGLKTDDKKLSVAIERKSTKCKRLRKNKKGKNMEKLRIWKRIGTRKKSTMSVCVEIHYVFSRHVSQYQEKKQNFNIVPFYLGTELPSHPAFYIIAMETSVADR